MYPILYPICTPTTVFSFIAAHNRQNSPILHPNKLKLSQKPTKDQEFATILSDRHTHNHYFNQFSTILGYKW